jgi:DNA-binding transcriptional MocR family regulator
MRREVDLFPGGGLLGTLGDWSSGDGPLQRKLATAIREAIEAGALLPGRKLPSERQLADLLAVSRTTVVAAYALVREQGLLDSRRGSGTRVSLRARPRRNPPSGRVPEGRTTGIVRRLISGDRTVISLACASWEDAAEIDQAVREMVDSDLPALLTESGYQPRGLLALREAVADHLTAAGLPTDTSQVLATNGAHPAITLATQLYAGRGATIVVENPSWPGYLDIFSGAGARLVGVPLDEEGIQSRQLDQVLAECAPAFICVMPTYHNPTGILMSESRRREVARLAARHRVPVIEDHSYVALAQAASEGRLPLPIAAYAAPDAEMLTVGSLDNALWRGLRIGWVRAPADIIESLAYRKSITDLGGPLLDHAVAARLLRQHERLIAHRSAELFERLVLLESLLRERLPSWRWRRPDGGTALWVRLPHPGATAYSQIALRHGVEIMPGPTMDPSGLDDTHVRVPFTSPPDVAAEFVERLARAWAEHAGTMRTQPCRPAELHYGK